MSTPKERNGFYDDFPYAVLYLAWDGLRIARCKSQEQMEQIFTQLKECYMHIQKVELKAIREVLKDE